MMPETESFQLMERLSSTIHVWSEAVAKGENRSCCEQEGKIEIAIIPELLPRKPSLLSEVFQENQAIFSLFNKRRNLQRSDYVGYGSVLSPESSIKTRLRRWLYIIRNARLILPRNATQWASIMQTSNLNLPLTTDSLEKETSCFQSTV